MDQREGENTRIRTARRAGEGFGYAAVVELETNARDCTADIVAALESMIEGDGARAVVYGNSAIAAVILLFERYEVDIAVSREIFSEVWMPITGSPLALEG